MIPTVSEEFLYDFSDSSLPSRDYKSNQNDKRISGIVEDLEAVKQAIYFMLNTERYQYLIYSWDYGVELSDLFGQPYSYVVPEIERRVTECLMQDDRIKEVNNFSVEKTKNNVHATFTVVTVYGEVESEVNVNV